MTNKGTNYGVFFRFTCIMLTIILLLSVSPEMALAAGEAGAQEQPPPPAQKNIIVPEHAIFYNGHTYAIYQIPGLNWKEQEAFCESLGAAAGVKAHLAVITSREENEAIRTMRPYAAIGAYESGGVWRWVDGTPLGRQVLTRNSRGDLDFIYVSEGFDGWCTSVHGLPHSGQQAREPDSFVPYLGQSYAGFNADYGWHNNRDMPGGPFICEFEGRVNFIFAEYNFDFDFSVPMYPSDSNHDVYPYVPGIYADIGGHTVAKPLKNLPARLEKQPEEYTPMHPEQEWDFHGWSYKSDSGKDELFGHGTGMDRQLVWDYKSRDPLAVCEKEPMLVLHAVWEDVDETGNITLNKKAATILKNMNLTLIATVDTKSDYTVTWTSSDNSVATVDQSGKVTGVKPGTAVITARTNKGKTAQCKIIVFHLDTGSFDFGSALSDSAKGPLVSFLGHDFPLFDIEIGAKLGLAHLAINYDEAEQKILVKLGKLQKAENENEDPDNYWKKEYAQIKQMAKQIGVKTDQAFYNSFREFRGKLVKSRSKLGIDCNAAVYGYLEYDVASGEPSLSEGGLIVSWDSDINVSARPVPAFPPLYIKFGLETAADGTLALKPKASNIYSPKFNVSGEINFTMAPYIAAGLELLGDKIYVEAGSKLTFDNTLKIGPVSSGDRYKMTCQGSVYLKSRILAFSQVFNIYYNKYQLYPKPKSAADVLSTVAFAPDTGKLRLSERKTAAYAANSETPVPPQYAAYDSVQAAGVAIDRLFASGTANPAVSVENERFALNTDLQQAPEPANMVKQNVYEHGEPVLAPLNGGRYLLVWVDDDPSRNDINRTALMYSVYHNEVWSTPRQVSNDGTADFSPKLLSAGSNVYLIWQNAGKKLDTGVRYEDMAKSMDISFAKFSQSSMSFSDIRNITALNKDIFEMSPVIAGDNDTISVYWTENKSNDVLDLSNTNSICKVTCRKGSWGMKEVVKSGLSYIGEISAAYVAGNESIAYTALGNAASTNPELHIIHNGTDKRIVNVAGTPTNIQISGGTLYWRDRSEIRGINIINAAATLQVMKIPLTPDARDIRILPDTSGTVRYIAWLSNIDYVNELFVSSYDLRKGAWTEGVRMTQNGKAVRDYTISLKSSGELVLVRDLCEILETGPESPMPFGRTDLTVDFLNPGAGH